jgi:mannose/fructose/N-acetylgalactosamine-specific phosphotransferase system component IIB
MPIVLVRVDDRLIHGQIIESWLPSTGAQELFIANDAVATDPIQQMILAAAIPSPIRLIMDSVEGIAAVLITLDAAEVRRMVLVDNPLDALRLMKAGVRFDRLNLGNLHGNGEKVSLSRTVTVSEDGLSALRAIALEGVSVHIQSVPYEKAVNLCDVCDCLPKA